MNTAPEHMHTDHARRLDNALLSLDGLSVGDAFGQLLSTQARSVRRVLERGALPNSKWWHTDDTQMAMAIVEELAANHQIIPVSLAHRFTQRYLADPGRGYGKGARMQLEEMAAGEPWQKTSAAAFNGRGSKGNGGAMRVAPLGAYFADDLERLVDASKASSIITHHHPEGVAGSIAIAVAAACAWNSKGLSIEQARDALWKNVMTWTPEFAARLLGSGFLVTTPDTVPFALWCAARHLNNYQEALIATLEGDGDCDTNCAIVGGIVVLHAGRESIPAQWLSSREPLNLHFDR